VAKKKLNE